MTDTLWQAERSDEVDSLWFGTDPSLRPISRARSRPKLAVSLPRVSLPRVSVPRVSLPRVSLPRVSIPRPALPRLSSPRFRMPSLVPPTFPVPRLRVDVHPWIGRDLRLPALLAALSFAGVEVIAFVARLIAGDVLSFLVLQLALLPVALAFAVAGAGAQLVRARRSTARAIREAEERAEVAASFYASNWKERIRSG